MGPGAAQRQHLPSLSSEDKLAAVDKHSEEVVSPWEGGRVAWAVASRSMTRRIP